MAAISEYDEVLFEDETTVNLNIFPKHCFIIFRIEWSSQCKFENRRQNTSLPMVLNKIVKNFVPIMEKSSF